MTSWKLKPKISTEDSNSNTQQDQNNLSNNTHTTQTHTLHLLSPSLHNTESINSKHDIIGSKFKFSQDPPNELDEIISHTNDSIAQFKLNHSNHIDPSLMQSFNSIHNQNNRKNKTTFKFKTFKCDSNISFTSDINKSQYKLEIDNNVSSVQIESGYPLTKQELNDNFKLLLKDGGIKRKIIKASNLSKPPKHSTVFIHYTATLPYSNNKKFYSTRDKGKRYKFKFGSSKVLKVLNVGVASMRKGQRCIFRCISKYAYGDKGSSSLNVPGGAICDFDVELIEYDDWKECDDEANGRMMKKILVANDNEDRMSIEKDMEINISYKIYYKDKGKECILCSGDNMGDVIVDGDDRFTNAFHMAVKTMVNGEKALFKILDKTLLNVNDIFIDEKESKDNKRVCPNGKDTIYEICIHEVCEWVIEDYEFEERIEYGLENKNKGNELFKQMRYNVAIKKYDKALEWIQFEFENVEENDDENDSELKDEKHELFIDINNNLTLIYVKMNKWKDAIKYATNVLEKSCDNVKALMRRGQARLEDAQFDESKKDLKYALTLDTNNNVIKKLLKKCNMKQKEYNEKQKKLYGKMYAKKAEKNSNECKQSNELKDNIKKENEYTKLKCEYDLLNDKYNNLCVTEQSNKQLIEQLQNENSKKDEKVKALKVEMEKQLEEKNTELDEKVTELEEEHKQEIANMINIKLTYKKMKIKYNELKNKNESNLLRMYALEKKLKKQQKTFGYKTWDCKDVADWIVKLDDKRYDKYYNILVQNLMNERITGECIGDLDKNDLHRLGITCFKDKFCVFNAIQKLVKNKYNENKECVVCMDDNRWIACVPCGHLCVCEKCKNVIDGTCPICQRKCVSFVKIYT